MIKIHSSYLKSYVDVAGILTKQYLYLISAQNYQIWKQFKDRTKIDEVIDKQFKDNNDNTNNNQSRQNIKITDKIATILISNMDLIDDKNSLNHILNHSLSTKREKILN